MSGDYQDDAKQRLFMALRYQANLWTCARSAVIKAEAYAADTKRRAIVSNRPGALIVPEGFYDDYIQRGESENRNKELKIELCGGRLSDHRFLANLLRLNMQVLVLNLIIRLGQRLWIAMMAIHSLCVNSVPANRPLGGCGSSKSPPK